MLNNPALKAKATDKPVKIRGVALNKTCPMPYEFPRVSENIIEYTSKGFCPITAINIPPAINDKITETIGLIVYLRYFVIVNSIFNCLQYF